MSGIARNQTITAPNLAQALRDQQGVFAIRQRDQHFIICPVSETTSNTLTSQRTGPNLSDPGVTEWEITRITDNSNLVISAVEEQTATGQYSTAGSGGSGGTGGGNNPSTSYS